jgi:hypothetical protein
MDRPKSDKAFATTPQRDPKSDAGEPDQDSGHGIGRVGYDVSAWRR